MIMMQTKELSEAGYEPNTSRVQATGGTLLELTTKCMSIRKYHKRPKVS